MATCWLATQGMPCGASSRLGHHDVSLVLGASGVCSLRCVLDCTRLASVRFCISLPRTRTRLSGSVTAAALPREGSVHCGGRAAAVEAERCCVRAGLCSTRRRLAEGSGVERCALVVMPMGAVPGLQAAASVLDAARCT